MAGWSTGPDLVAPGATMEGLVIFLPQRGGPASGEATLDPWVTDEARQPLRAGVPLRWPPPSKVTAVEAAPET